MVVGSAQIGGPSLGLGRGALLGPCPAHPLCVWVRLSRLKPCVPPMVPISPERRVIPSAGAVGRYSSTPYALRRTFVAAVTAAVQWWSGCGVRRPIRPSCG